MFYRKDIRDYGSGNPGLTNFYRVFGKWATLLVVLIDVLKTIAPVIFGGWLFGQFTDMVPNELWVFDRFYEALFGQLIAGFFVMMGHCFPVFYKFKGGKGVMAIGTIVIVIDWRLALIGWGIFILITLITRFISLASMLGSAGFPTAMFIINVGGIAERGVAILCVLLVVVRHMPNIKRIIKGEESRFSFKRKKDET